MTYPIGSALVFTAWSDNAEDTTAVVKYPDRPDTADRTVRAGALDGAVVVIGLDKDDPTGDAHRVRNASGAEFTAWDDELEPHRDTHQTYDAVTDPRDSFVTHCTCGHTTRGSDPDDADAKMIEHTNPEN